MTAAIAVAIAGLLAIRYERRLARQEAETRRAMRELEMARAGLFETIAHGLDHRFQAIAEQSARIRRTPPASKTHAAELANIQYQVERLQRFAADVRDVIAIGAGSLPVEKTPIDLRDVVQNAATAHANFARAYNVELKVTCEASLPVLGDEPRLTQVVHDLLRNAFNFTAPGGTIHMIGGPIENAARLVVQDTGRGMSSDELGMLFRPFTRAHGPGESREPGTGTGLYVAKGILQAHGGRIYAESDGRGRGSRFTIEIPLHARPFDIRNAPKPPSGTPQLPPALANAGLAERR